jgi:hypothetical protein
MVGKVSFSYLDLLSARDVEYSFAPTWAFPQVAF